MGRHESGLEKGIPGFRGSGQIKLFRIEAEAPREKMGK